MPRGEHPNSRKNLSKGKPFDAETARKAKVKSDEAKIIKKSITEDLRDRCTPELIGKINRKLISMATSGNLKAYELIRDALGEKPTEKIEYEEIGAGAQTWDLSKLTDKELDQLGEIVEKLNAEN